MKIMHIIDSGGLYGAEAMLLDLMVGQKKIGLQPFLCSIGTADSGEKEIEREATRRGLELTAPRFRAGLNPHCAVSILRIARTRQIDIIHSHGYKGNILAGIIPRSVRKIPLISTLHGWTNTRAVSKMALYEWLDRRMLRYKDAVVAVNKLMLEDARFKSAKIDRNSVYIVNNGIDSNPDSLNNTAKKDRTDITEFTRDGFIIGAIGRLSAEKGFEFLLAAIALLHKQGLGVKLVLAGDGPLRADLQQQAISLGIDKIVLFTGYLANASLYLDCFDVLTISSLSEGLPITLLEAMRANVPVISTRVGGIPDVIADGKSGLLVNPGNAEELGEAIKWMAANPEMHDSMIKRAESRFRDNYTSEIMVMKYLDIYKKLTRND